MQQERESAELCANGCGFFGAPASGGMCSVCWKKTMSKRAVESAAPAASSAATSAATPEARADASNNDSAAAASAAPAAAVTVDAAPAVATTTTEESAAPAAKAVQKNKSRCWECKKKVGLTAIECRCGYVFCNGHRYADQHACTFDFKAADRAELARRNPGGGQFGKIDKL